MSMTHTSATGKWEEFVVGWMITLMDVIIIHLLYLVSDDALGVIVRGRVPVGLSNANNHGRLMRFGSILSDAEAGDRIQVKVHC